MNKVTMFNANQQQFMQNMRVSFNDEALIQEKLDNYHNWQDVGEFFTELSGEEAAEFAFDLSNNPRMHNERKLVQGLTRSLSIGDVVMVTEVDEDGFETYHEYLCLNSGWSKVL